MTVLTPWFSGVLSQALLRAHIPPPPCRVLRPVDGLPTASWELKGLLERGGVGGRREALAGWCRAEYL